MLSLRATKDSSKALSKLAVPAVEVGAAFVMRLFMLCVEVRPVMIRSLRGGAYYKGVELAI